MKNLVVIVIACVLIGCGATGITWIPTGGGITYTPDGGVTACITVPLNVISDAGIQ